MDALRDVRGEFHHLRDFSVRVEDRAIGALEPDLISALAEPLKLGRVVLALAEVFPELAIFSGFALGRVHEDTVMPALDFVERVTHRLEEFVVRPDDGSVDGELDDGLRPSDGRDLRGVIEVEQTRPSVGPFDGEARPLSPVHDRYDHQIECAAAHADRRGVRLFQLGQHVALVGWILVEDVDVAADQRVHAESGQFSLQFGLGLLHQLDERFVHVGDVEFLVGQHHVGAQRVRARRSFARCSI